MTGDRFGAIAKVIDQPLTVVTVASGAERAGCLVGFHSQSSIHPCRYAVWLSRANHTFRVAVHSTHVAVHFLGRDQAELADRFGSETGDDIDKFEGLDVEAGAGGVPVLCDCRAGLVGRRVTLLDEGGDHVCVVVDVDVVWHGDRFVPLRLSESDDLRAGHAPDERPLPTDLGTD